VLEMILEKPVLASIFPLPSELRQTSHFPFGIRKAGVELLRNNSQCCTSPEGVPGGRCIYVGGRKPVMKQCLLLLRTAWF
jgi:hypothetical protein